MSGGDAPSGVLDEIFLDGFDLSVDAGYGLVAITGTNLQLNASASGYTTLSWQQIEGTPTSLSNSCIEDPTLTLPVVASSETLVYELAASSDPV